MVLQSCHSEQILMVNRPDAVLMAVVAVFPRCLERALPDLATVGGSVALQQGHHEPWHLNGVAVNSGTVLSDVAVAGNKR